MVRQLYFYRLSKICYLECFKKGRIPVHMMLDDQSKAATVIRSVGLRATRQRAAVLHVVEQQPHSTTAAVLKAVSALVPDVSHQAVYDCLAHLTQVGLLRRLQVDGGAAMYETRAGDNHHHCVCRSCGLVVDVDCAAGQTPCLDPCDAAGFVIDEAEVTYRGLCPACSSKPTTTECQNPKEKSDG